MNEDRIHLQVVTASGTQFDAMTSYVGLPLVGGRIGILSDHAPMLAALEGGTLLCTTQGERKEIPVGGGIVEIRDNKVLVLAHQI